MMALQTSLSHVCQHRTPQARRGACRRAGAQEWVCLDGSVVFSCSCANLEADLLSVPCWRYGFDLQLLSWGDPHCLLCLHATQVVFEEQWLWELFKQAILPWQVLPTTLICHSEGGKKSHCHGNRSFLGKTSV